MRRLFDVGAEDEPVGAAAAQPAEVHATLAGKAADQRGYDRDGRGRRALGGGRRALVGRRPHPAAARRGGLRAVADEHIARTLVRGGRRGFAGRGVADPGVTGGRGIADGDGQQRGADGQFGALVAEAGGDHAPP
ncbi:hypothetical protein GCM10020000_40980 [Streptomyces olivoverticillatus]